MEIRISVEAEADLQNQWLHLASNSSLDSANTFEARVDHVLALLADQLQETHAFIGEQNLQAANDSMTHSTSSSLQYHSIKIRCAGEQDLLAAIKDQAATSSES